MLARAKKLARYRWVPQIAWPEARTIFNRKNYHFKVQSYFLFLSVVLVLDSGLEILAYALVMLARLNSFETLDLKICGKTIA